MSGAGQPRLQTCISAAAARCSLRPGLSFTRVKGQDTSQGGRDGNLKRIAPRYMGWGGGGFAGAVAPVFEEVKAYGCRYHRAGTYDP
jgi:hypothetical protein